MSTWQSTALETDAFPHWANPATLDVDPQGGLVQLERRNADGNWESFEVFDTAGAFKIDVVNSPELRVTTTSGAKFRWTWAS